MTDTDYTSLNASFRAALASITPRALGAFEELLRDSLGYKSIRNIQLMTRQTSSTREFVTARQTPESRKLRATIAKLVIDSKRLPNFPVKEANFGNHPLNMDSGKFSNYLEQGSYTRKNAARLRFYADGTVSMEYALYSNSDDDDEEIDFNDPTIADLVGEF